MFSIQRKHHLTNVSTFTLFIIVALISTYGTYLMVEYDDGWVRYIQLGITIIAWLSLRVRTVSIWSYCVSNKDVSSQHNDLVKKILYLPSLVDIAFIAILM